MDTEQLVTLRRQGKTGSSCTVTPALHHFIRWWVSAPTAVGDGGWTAMLPDITGRQQSMNWLAANTSNDASTCLALGLSHQVVEDDCYSCALRWAEKVAGHQASSITRTRKLLNTVIESLSQRLETERENFVSQVQTGQALEGIDSFPRRKEHV